LDLAELVARLRVDHDFGQKVLAADDDLVFFEGFGDVGFWWWYRVRGRRDTDGAAAA
jgi:hypothetical protein